MRLLIVEDETILRRHLMQFVADCFPAAVVSEAKSVSDLHTILNEKEVFDLALVDLDLPDGNALAWVNEVKKRYGSTKILILSSEHHEFVIHRALHSEINGFVHKNDEPAILIAALRAVLAGGHYISPTVNAIRQKIHSSPTFFQKLLSPREQELLVLMGKGYNDEEIAAQLSIKTSGVGAHRKNLMTKLDLHSREQLVAYAKAKGFDRISSK